MSYGKKTITALAVTCCLVLAAVFMCVGTKSAEAAASAIAGEVVQDTFITTDSTEKNYASSEIMKMFRNSEGSVCRYSYVMFSLADALNSSEYENYKQTAKLNIYLKIVNGAESITPETVMTVKASPASVNAGYYSASDLNWLNCKTTGEFKNLAFGTAGSIVNNAVYDAETGIMKISVAYSDVENYVYKDTGEYFGRLTIILASDISGLQAATSETADAPKIEFAYETAESYSVTAQYDENLGSVTFDKTAVSAGETVTMTVVPAEGVSVTRAELNGKVIALDENLTYTSEAVYENLVFAVTFKAPVTEPADKHRVPVIEDTWIEAKSTTVHGHEYLVHACSSNNNRAYLKFDLSGIDITANIHSLELVVYVNANRNDTSPKTFKVRYGTVNDWSEDTLVWANKTATSSSGQVTISHKGELGMLRVDITAQYEKFIKGNNSVITLILWESSANDRVDIVTKDAFDANGNLLPEAAANGIKADAFAPYLDFDHEFSVTTEFNEQLGSAEASVSTAMLNDTVVFAVTPNEGKKIKKVTLNGEEVTLDAEKKYSATVTGDMLFKVEFSDRDPYVYQLVLSNVAHGKILCEQSFVTEGDTGKITVYFIPDAGYALVSASMNTADITGSISEYAFVLDKAGVSSEVTFLAVFGVLDDGKLYPKYDTTFSDVNGEINTAFGEYGKIEIKSTDLSLRTGAFLFDITGLTDYKKVFFKVFAAQNIDASLAYKLSLYGWFDFSFDNTSTFGSALSNGMFGLADGAGADLFGRNSRIGIFAGESQCGEEMTFDITNIVDTARLLGKTQVTLILVNSYNESASISPYSVYSANNTEVVSGKLNRPYVYTEKQTVKDTFIVNVGNDTDDGKVVIGDGETNEFKVNSTVPVTLLPVNGERVKEVKINGKTADVYDNKFYINGMQTDAEIEVVFEKIYEVDVTAGEHIRANVGKTVIGESEELVVYFALDKGYRIDSVTINGQKTEIYGNKLILTDVTGDVTVNVTAAAV